MRRVETEDLSPGPGQVMVRVAACALGFPDLLMCRAGYQHQPALPFSPGAEIYGEIVHVGPGVDLGSLAPGSKVVGLGVDLHGGLAEYALIPSTMVFAAPDGLDAAESSALLGAYLTGWLALYRTARLQAGEVLLVHAAAGGVGSAAVQLGLAAGATVIGVTRGERKAAIVHDLGAHRVIDRERASVVDAVNVFTNGNGADVSFDPVGGPSWFESTKCVAFEGRLLPIGFAGGEILSQPLNHPLVKNYSILGVNSGLFTVKRPDVVAQAVTELSGLVACGAVRPLIGQRVPFAEAPGLAGDRRRPHHWPDGRHGGRSPHMTLPPTGERALAATHHRPTAQPTQETTSMEEFKDKVVVVTGGSRGMGKQVVLAFAERGAHVVIASRKLEACESLAEEVHSRFGVRALPVACNVSDWSQCDELAEATYAEFGRADILINNAGLSPHYPSLIEVTEALFDKTIAVNLRGPFRLSAVFGHRMVEDGGGAIVNIGSIEAIRPEVGALPYAAAKSGLHVLTEGFAQAYAPTVRVNTIQPGPFLTDIADNWAEGAREKIEASVVLGRCAEPEEVVGAVLFFSGSASSYSTGAVLRVDGGWK